MGSEISKAIEMFKVNETKEKALNLGTIKPLLKLKSKILVNYGMKEE